MGKLGKNSGNIVNEQWKHCENLKPEGSGLKGSGPLLLGRGYAIRLPNLLETSKLHRGLSCLHESTADLAC
jgi:hypothetical protein